MLSIENLRLDYVDVRDGYFRFGAPNRRMDHVVSKYARSSFQRNDKEATIFGVPVYPLFGVVTMFIGRRHHK
jgi:hypothetical protein